MSLLLSTLTQIAASLPEPVPDTVSATKGKKTASAQKDDALSTPLDAARFGQRILIHKGRPGCPLRYLDTAWGRTITLPAQETPLDTCLVPLDNDRWLIFDPKNPIQVRGHQDDLTLVLTTGELDIHEDSDGYAIIAYRSAKPGDDASEIVTVPSRLTTKSSGIAHGVRNANRIHQALLVLGPYLDTKANVETYRSELVVELNPALEVTLADRYKLYALAVYNQAAKHIWEI